MDCLLGRKGVPVVPGNTVKAEKDAVCPSSDPVALFKCLGDRTRYDILCRLLKTDSYVELLAEELSLTPGTVSFHLKKMESAGLVRCSRMQFYQIYSLNRELLSAPILSFLTPASLGEEERYRNSVLAAFFEGKRLIRVPVQQKKKLIVLEKVVSLFEKGKIYEEPAVNEILDGIFDDHCLLRRELISAGLMERDHEKYRRI